MNLGWGGAGLADIFSVTVLRRVALRGSRGGETGIVSGGAWWHGISA